MKRHFDEIAEDQRLTDPEKMFKVGVFYACIDTDVSQLKQCFKGLNTIAKRFRFLRPSELVHATDDELRACAETFAVTYNDDISSEFPSQLLSFRSALRSEIKKLEMGSVKDLAELLILKHTSILPSVTDVATALKLFLTVPVTVASGERSFSKLKLIKTCMRSTMSQDRLSELAILSIESQHARQMDITDIVKDFAQKNARRKGRFGGF